MAELNRWKEHFKIKYFGYVLKGTARLWYMNFIRNTSENTWDSLIAEFKKVFANASYIRKLKNQLRRNKQLEGQNLLNYYYEVLDLCYRLNPNMSDNLKKEYIEDGLLPKYVYRISMKRPQTLADLLKNIELIIDCEEKIKESTSEIIKDCENDYDTCETKFDKNGSNKENINTGLSTDELKIIIRDEINKYNRNNKAENFENNNNKYKNKYNYQGYVKDKYKSHYENDHNRYMNKRNTRHYHEPYFQKKNYYNREPRLNRRQMYNERQNYDRKYKQDHLNYVKNYYGQDSIDENNEKYCESDKYENGTILCLSNLDNPSELEQDECVEQLINERSDNVKIETDVNSENYENNYIATYNQEDGTINFGSSKAEHNVTAEDLINIQNGMHKIERKYFNEDIRSDTSESDKSDKSEILKSVSDFIHSASESVINSQITEERSVSDTSEYDEQEQECKAENKEYFQKLVSEKLPKAHYYGELSELNKLNEKRGVEPLKKYNKRRNYPRTRQNFVGNRNRLKRDDFKHFKPNFNKNYSNYDRRPILHNDNYDKRFVYGNKIKTFETDNNFYKPRRENYFNYGYNRPPVRSY